MTQRLKLHVTWLYPTAINDTNIVFTQKELDLLDRCIKYTLNCKDRQWIKTLALEAETAMNKLNPTERTRTDQTSSCTKHLYLYQQYRNRENYNNKKHNNDRLTLNGIQRELLENKAIVTKADKRNTLRSALANTVRKLYTL